MTSEERNKLISVLKSNTKWPIIIEGITSSYFKDATIIPADIPSSDLGVVPTENGIKYPAWAMELILKSKKTSHRVLCIDKIDSIPDKDQEKFYGLIKVGGINGFKFPDGTQIIITASDMNKVSPKLSALTLIYKVK